MSAPPTGEAGPSRQLDADLLTEATVVPYLAARGIALTDDAPAERLSGGVSNVVLRVALPHGDVVVKQALGRLAVEDDWFADRARSHTEAEALVYLAAVFGGYTPALLDDDPEKHALTIEGAPRDWPTLKSVLMSCDVPIGVLRGLGVALRQWHLRSGRDVAAGTAPVVFDNPMAFRQLRLDPYFTVSAQRLPAQSAAIEQVAVDIAGRRDTLVLGDFSPKNVLVEVGTERFWAIDMEVAHIGDPAFDVAFMSSHLLLKWLHLPAARDSLRHGLQGFLDSYGEGPGAEDLDHLGRVVGCLMLARVAGSSPVEYLTTSERGLALDCGRRLLDGPVDPDGWTEVFA